MRIKYNSIIVFKKIVHKLFLCCLFLILSCDEANYVLNNPSKQDAEEISLSIGESFQLIDILLDGEFEKFTKQLHTR